MSSLELDQEKLTRCRNRLIESYFGASIVERAVETVDYNEVIHGSLDFLNLGRWYYIPKDWFTDPSYYPDLVFSDVGRGIAIGEEKHIVEKIFANSEVNRITMDTVDYENIRAVVDNLASESTSIQRTLLPPQLSMFAPIEYFVTMHIDWAREHPTSIRPNELVVDGSRINLFWSNKYIDYKEFIIFEKSLCRWIAKPNVNNRLEVEIRESEKLEKMELKAQTVFNFTIVDPHRIRVLHPTRIPET